MKLTKRKLQELHDRIKKIADDEMSNAIAEECEILQNHIYTLEDDEDSSNPPGNPPPPPGPRHP